MSEPIRAKIELDAYDIMRLERLVAEMYSRVSLDRQSLSELHTKLFASVGQTMTIASKRLAKKKK